jgi:hypothetical protein
MKNNSEEQIINILKEADAGISVVQLCRKPIFSMLLIPNGKRNIVKKWPPGSMECVQKRPLFERVILKSMVSRYQENLKKARGKD